MLEEVSERGGGEWEMVVEGTARRRCKENQNNGQRNCRQKQWGRNRDAGFVLAASFQRGDSDNATSLSKRQQWRSIAAVSLRETRWNGSIPLVLTIDSSSNHSYWAADVKTFHRGLGVGFFGGQNLINYLKMSIKAGSSSGIVLPPLYHLPSCKMLQHVSLPGRQLHFPTSILFNTSRCFTLPFFMALVSVFLGQSTLVFCFC